MPKFSPGDIIIKASPIWGDTLALVLAIGEAGDIDPDDVEYYELLYLSKPNPDAADHHQLATWLVDKLYKLKA
jgi:hypothetical protein